LDFLAINIHPRSVLQAQLANIKDGDAYLELRFGRNDTSGNDSLVIIN